jgi:arsenate reductase
VEGSDADKRRAFRDAFNVLSRRIGLFASLPLDKLTGLALHERVRQIGKE